MRAAASACSTNACSKQALSRRTSAPAAGEPIGRIEYLFEKDEAFLALAAHPVLLKRSSGSTHRICDYLGRSADQSRASRFSRLHHQDSLYQSRRAPVYRSAFTSIDRTARRFVSCRGLSALAHFRRTDSGYQARATEEQHIPAEAGDVIVHDTLLIHASDVHRERLHGASSTGVPHAGALRLDSPWGAG